MIKDEIYEKAKKVNGLGGMTINARLHLTGLMDAKSEDKELARMILEAIRVDKQSIDKILD